MRYRILALILVLIVCLSFARTEGNYRVNGKDLHDLDIVELYELNDAVQELIWTKAQESVLYYEGKVITIFVEDTKYHILHMPYCHDTFFLGNDRRIVQSTANYLLANGYVPCSECHPESMLK